MISAAAKRAFDLTLALAGLIALSPFFTAMAILILAIEGRPIFFTQSRVGRGGKLFSLYKFRTMRLGGPQLLATSQNDVRITGIGYWMRRYKVDELPQLLNVLKGDMSLVGPRPEVPKFVDLFRAEYDTILTMRPGLTDPASIKFRDESALLGSGDTDAESAYVERVLPVKLKYNLEYVRNHSLPADIRLIFKTFAVIFRPSD